MTIVLDHGRFRLYPETLQTIAISEFKAKCLAILERVRTTGQPILVTRRGEPVAQVAAPPPKRPADSRFGCMSGSAKETEDILEPLDESDWEVLQ